MPTRYGPEQQSRDWPYPPDLAGFLEAVRADPSDETDTKMRIAVFMMTPVARRMPPQLRRAIEAAGLWEEARGSRRPPRR